MPITEPGLRAAVTTFEEDWTLTIEARDTLAAFLHVANAELDLFRDADDTELRQIAGDERLDAVVARVRASDTARGLYPQAPPSPRPALKGVTIIHLFTGGPYIRELATAFPNVRLSLIVDKD